VRKRSSRLRSRPFIALYLVAVGAVVLDLGRHRWAGNGWYPGAIGVLAAAGIIAVTNLFDEFVSSPRRGGVRVTFLFFCAALPAVGGVYVIRTEPWLALSSFGMSALFLWGACGTLFGWPGFRPPAAEDECPVCRYNLTGNVSGRCPECGAEVCVARDEDLAADSVDDTTGQ